MVQLFKDSEGEFILMESSGGKYAFMVTFMWYASYIVWMVNVGSGGWIVLSNAILGLTNKVGLYFWD